MKISRANKLYTPFFSVEVGKEDFIKSMLVHEEVGKKEDAPCWSPILWRDDKRAKANAESFSCVVLDVDTPITEEDLRSELERAGYEAVAHETWTKGHWRLVFFVEGSAHTFATVLGSVSDALHIQGDTAASALDCMYFTPSRPKGELRKAFHVAGTGF